MTVRPGNAADSRPATPLWAAGLILMAGFLWSLQGVTIRLLEAATSEQIIFWRNLAQCSALILFIAVRSRGDVVGTIRRAGLLGCLGGTFQTMSSVTVVFAFAYTTVANVNFILSTSPFMTGLLAWVILRERLALRTIIAMAVALGGVGIMMLDGLAGGHLIGNGLAVFTTLGFSALAIILRIKRHVDMLPTIFWGAGFGAIAGFILSGGKIDMPMHDILLCVVMGAIQIGLGQALFVMASRYVQAALLAFLSLSEIVLGPIWAWLGVNEVPSELTLVGGGVVIAALVWQAWMGARRTR